MFNQAFLDQLGANLQSMQNAPSVDNKTVNNMKTFLQNSLVEIFGSSERSEYELILLQLNSGQTMGVCAKQMNYGDVAWRCFDCEKDPTCIICSECFEKGNHEGHRVQLKRNVGGCCDCGDPEAWDPKGFCCDHKGLHEADPKQILEKMPAQIKNSATSVFNGLSLEIKRISMELEDADNQFQKAGMSVEKYRQTRVFCVKLIFQFLRERIEECPSFIYIIDEALNRVVIDKVKFPKNESHLVCCVRTFVDSDGDKAEAFQKTMDEEDDKEVLCTCTTLDICFQTNRYLDNQTREIVYDFLFKMFQSYHFKQCLTHSYAANFKSIKHEHLNDDNDISSIGVQVLTSDEMTMLIVKNDDLRNNIIMTLIRVLGQFKNDQHNHKLYWCIQTILHDIKYMARPESLKYCLEHTDWVEQLIKALNQIYFVDIKQQRESIVLYQQEGQPNQLALELELQFQKISCLYLKELKFDNPEKNLSILRAFLDSFMMIDTQMKFKDYESSGFFNIPIHRSFAFYLTRLMFSKYLESGKQDGLDIGQQFSLILKDNLPSSSLEDQYQDFDHICEIVLLAHIKQVSFVHEIEAKKWIFHGEHLGQYPHIYYRLNDRFAFQDLALLQIMLSLDPGKEDKFCVFDYFISNFGLDQQLQHLIESLKNKSLDVDKIKKAVFQFDPNKLKLELISFLKLIVQICVCEISFLKQLVNRKDEKAQQQHHIQNTNSEQVIKIWKAAVKKEAVHLLLLNKLNSSIGVLKENMIEVVAKDEHFEQALFEVSTQSRDMKNQVKFKLKDEYYPWFDPYQYLSPEHHSMIFQMYQENGLKDKFIDEGLNDIVGDYKGKYEFATELNDQLMQNLAKSQIIRIIAPLIVNWLKQDVIKPKNDPVTFDEEQMEKMKTLMTPSFMARVQGQSFMMQNTQKMIDVIKAQKGVSKNMIEKDLQVVQVIQELQQLAEKNKQDSASEEHIFQILQDPNLGNICLKILVILLRAHHKNQSLSRDLMYSELNFREQILITSLMSYRDKLHQEESKKAANLITFILEKIYTLNPEMFPKLATFLGYDSSNQIDKEMTDESQPVPEKKEQSKSSDLKKKKAAMLAKMKKKQSKYIIQNTKEETAQEPKKEEQEEVFTCAFCQELLTKESFFEQPFGNFAYIQKTKIYYHSSKQTYKSHMQTMKNSDLANQFKQQQQTDTFEMSELKQSSKDSDNEIDDNQIVPETKKLPRQDICTISGKFMNPFTGSSAVMTSCKHYAHRDCLNKYYNQQATNHEQMYQKQICGFEDGEFQCPICKSINNTVFPMYSLDEVAKASNLFGDIPVPNNSEEFTIDDKSKKLIDFYMDFFSLLTIQQQGQVDRKRCQNEASYKKLTQSILLRDFKEDTQRVVETFSHFITSNIMNIDIKGLSQFKQQSENISKMIGSIRSLLKVAFEGKHIVLDSVKLPASQSTLDSLVFGIIEESVEDMLSDDAKIHALTSNVISTCIQTLLSSSLKFLGSELFNHQIKYILNQFYSLIRVQIAMANQFRKNFGVLSGEMFDVMKNLSSLQIVVESQDADLEEFELPVLRKLFTIVYILKLSNSSDQEYLHQVFNEITSSNSNQEEIERIKAFLQIDESKSIRDLLIEPQNGEPEEEKNDHPEEMFEIVACLDKFSKQKFLSDLLWSYAQSLTDKNSSMMETIEVNMPLNLLLMTPYFQLDLIQIPQSFMNLQTEYYKRKCVYCNKQVKDHATCLLTGDTMCWINYSYKDEDFVQCKSQWQEKNEGLLTYNTRINGGGQGAYLHCSTGQIILMNGGTPGIFDSPYRNKYGEVLIDSSKVNDQYVIDETGGGIECLNLLKKRYMDFQLANDVVQQRTNPDSKFKIYKKNLL